MSPTLEWLFEPLFRVSVVAWSLVTGALVLRRTLFEFQRSSLLRARERVRQAAAVSPDAAARTVGLLLNGVPRRTIERIVADSHTRDDDARVLSTFALERWGVARLARDAAASGTWRGPWRRIAALCILAHGGRPEALPLLAAALADRDRRVVSAAVATLGRMPTVAAADLLIEALRRNRYLASRIATELESFPLPIGERLLPLLAHPSTRVRYWAAALLYRYRDLAGLEAALAPLAADPDAGVRRAVVQALGEVGGPRAATVALGLLDDPVPFVRAHAARAVGTLRLTAHADRVAPLLADHDWWVRLAATEALVALGPESWPVVVRELDSADAFARNAAAEVLQNGGALVGLIRRDVTGELDAAGRALLDRIAEAGGPGLLNLPPGEEGDRLHEAAARARLAEVEP